MEANETLWYTREIDIDIQNDIQSSDLQSSTRRKDHHQI